MPMRANAETGLPEFYMDVPPEDPANPDTVPVADESTPPKIEDEHEGVVVLVQGETMVAEPPRNPDSDEDDDFDKEEPPYEEPEGDPDDNDQPSGNPEDDEHIPAGNKHPPTRETPPDLPAPEWEGSPV